MINWKELEKFIAPGKVCTLVVMVDGKEIGAFSFNIETLAYKESLESVSKIEPAEKIYIPDKVAEAKPVTATKTTKGKETKHKHVAPVVDDNDDESPFIDEDTGEVIEEAKAEEKIEEKPKNQTISNAAPERMTRDQIMNASEVPDRKEPTNAQREEYENFKQPENLVLQREYPKICNECKLDPVKCGFLPDNPNNCAHFDSKKVVEQTFGEDW